MVPNFISSVNLVHVFPIVKLCVVVYRSTVINGVGVGVGVGVGDFIVGRQQWTVDGEKESKNGS